jgi:uncharacterized UBP type Zn finger protein
VLVAVACPHADQIADVSPGLEVCESCIEIGGTWVHLRQCLTCGRTGCCDSSPNKHATAHQRQTGHPIIRSLEPGEDWTWCYGCGETIRQGPDGVWEQVDQFFEAGLWYAGRRADETGNLMVEPDAITPDGFPLGTWMTTYQARRREGALDDEQVASLEALPGWQW